MIPRMLQTITEYVKGLMESINLDCYVIFNSDEHLSEYIGPKDERVYHISGFTGSNATIVIGSKSCIITDSRYYIQAEEQTNLPLYKDTLISYIFLNKFKRISFDTKTLSFKKFKTLMQQFKEKGIEFVETNFEFNIPAEKNSDKIINLEQYNFEDFLKFQNYENVHSKEVLNGYNSVKTDMINYKNLEINPQIKKYLNYLGFENFKGNVTGSSYKDKISKIRSIIKDKTLIVSELDTICWILNLRGNDIHYNPVFYSYLVIDSQSTILFCDKKIALEGVTVVGYREFDKYLNTNKNKQILISSDCNQFIFGQLSKAEATEEIRNLQACKNEIELSGMALAYFFDGLALTELFAFISRNSNLTEEDISLKLYSIKRKFPGYVQESFETISSTGANAAIVHHKAGKTVVDKNKIYLIDCGSQYYFGTTDTTRTLHFGKDIPIQQKHDYTLVLKGQINAMIKSYSLGSKYSDIDLISRNFLKEENKDFGHATGHGVGHFLCVHEHPPVIYPKASNEIKSEHVFSIEPGYYKDYEYGIRIENLVISRKSETGFKIQNITLVPYQNALLEVEILTNLEKQFYNECNQNCKKFLGSFLSSEANEFLEINSFEIK